jgi:hypothetical protein
LVIEDADTGRVYATRPAPEGMEFAISFVHSVNQSPVTDVFRVEGAGIRPVEARFRSFGAGIPDVLEDGLSLSRDGPGLVVTGFRQDFTELRYIVGVVSDHILFIQGERVSLRSLCGKNAHIVIKIQPQEKKEE